MAGIEDDLLSYLSWWVKKKRLQIFLRSHLSHVLALFLALLVMFRERHDLYEVWLHPSSTTFWHVFVIFITICTLLAAIWEFSGNKLATTPQDIRFVLAIRSLLTQLEKFKREMEKKAFPERVNRFTDFSDLFLKLTSNTLCGKKEVAGGLMIYQMEKENLSLLTYTPGSMYQHGLEIPLTGTLKKDQKGPATKAFESGAIAYMPKKDKRIGVLLEAAQGESYSLVDMFKGWYPSQSATEEKFGAVLSVPVSIYNAEGEKVNYGILNYTTVKRDFFVPRDYIMAECFASIMAQAIHVLLSKDDVKAEPSGVAPTENQPAPTGGAAKTHPAQKTQSGHSQPRRKKKSRGSR
jgi:hypothetical protein